MQDLINQVFDGDDDAIEARLVAARAMLAALRKVNAFNGEASETYTERAKDGTERRTTVFDEINGCIHPDTINGMCDAVSAAIAAAEAAGITAD